MRVAGRFWIIAAAFSLLIVLQWPTLASMAATWSVDETFGHGYVIPLIAAWLAWQRRHAIASITPAVWWPGLVAVAGLVLIWTLATLINVQVLEQFAFVGLFSALVLTLAGRRQFAASIVPLSYLYFAVPFGEPIVPILMEWTADFTVKALQLFGMPVLRDGLYFSTANGNFEVAEACSGIRYLIASAAAGVAFAFSVFESGKKRLVFILVSLIVPIIANGIRAVAIVLIAHYSDMRLAQGIDHFIYGWFFFAVVIFLLFAIGARYADPPGEPDSAGSGDEGTVLSFERPRLDPRSATATLVVASLLATGPALAAYRTQHFEPARIQLPRTTVLESGWRGPEPGDAGWRLEYRGASATAEAAYERGQGGARAELRIAIYGVQTQRAEMINATNRIAAEETWRTVRLGSKETGHVTVPVVQAELITSGSRRYLVWYWYQQGGRTTVSTIEAKWLELLALFKPSPATIVAVGVPVDGDRSSAEASLDSFIGSVVVDLKPCIDGEHRPGTCHPWMPSGHGATL